MGVELPEKHAELIDQTGDRLVVKAAEYPLEYLRVLSLEHLNEVRNGPRAGKGTQGHRKRHRPARQIKPVDHQNGKHEKAPPFAGRERVAVDGNGSRIAPPEVSVQ